MGQALKKYWPALLAILWFLVMANRGLTEDFNSDDVMNLAVAYLKPAGAAWKGAVLFWTGYIRPVGALFYLGMYSYAGYWSVPFRVACFGLIAVNLVLAYRLFWKVGGSRKFAGLAVLLVSFQAVFGDIYMSTGTVYDTLCQLFLLVALNLYVGEVTLWRAGAIGLCAVAAMGSKEVGVALPGVMLAYDFLVRRKAGNNAASRRIACATVIVVAAVFAAGRLLNKSELAGIEAYQLIVTGPQYLLTTQNYVNLILGTHLNAWLALGVFLLPLLTRSRLVVFGWLYYMITLAPMSFAMPRAGYALYVPFTGIAIMAAALLARFPIAIGAALIVTAQIWSAWTWTRQDEHPWGHEPIRAIADGVGSRYPALPKGARLLLVNDPFGKQELFTPKFVLWLRYHDPTLYIQKSTWDKASGRFVFPAEPYDHVFLFAGDATWEFTQRGVNGNEDFAMDGRPLPYVEMKADESELSIVKDVGGISKGDQQRWVNQDPEFAFRVPKQPANFRMDFDVPDIILRAVGPMRIHCWIADRPAPDLIVSKHERRRYEVPLPAGLKRGEIVHVRLHVDNPFVSKTDGAKLSFLLWAAGFYSSAGGSG